MAEQRPTDGAMPADHVPSDAVVVALALDVALDLARVRRTATGTAAEHPVDAARDDLLEMADAVRAIAVADRSGARCSPATPAAAPAAATVGGATTYVPHAIPAVPLRPVSLTQVTAPARHARRQARRRHAAVVAAVAASVATLAIGADLALQAGGGGTARPGWALPAATRMTLTGDRVVLVPPGGGPAAADRVTAVTCTTARHCLAIADAGGHAVVAVSDDGGATWQRQPAPATTLSAILCATPVHCWTVGSTRSGGGNEAVVVGTDDGGRTWTTETVPAGVTSLQSVSCPTVETCWAVGSAGSTAAAIVGTDDGGRTWTTETVPAGVTSLQSVSCPTVETCWAGGQVAGTAAVVATTDGGSRWEQRALSLDDPPATGAGAGATTRQPAAAGPTTISSITCAPPGTCWATATATSGGGGGGPVTVLADAPGGWHVSARAPADPTRRSGLVVVPECLTGCPTPNGGTGNAALATIEQRTGPDLRGRTAHGALTCPTPVECWVVQASGAGFRSTVLDPGTGRTA